MVSFFKKILLVKILVLYCFKVYRCMNKTHEKRQGRIELRVQKMTINKKLTMISLKLKFKVQ